MVNKEEKSQKVVLSIDPGKKKCGIAIVNNSLEFISGGVVDNENIVERITFYLNRYDIENIIIGSGTNFKNIFDIVKKNFSEIRISKVMEKDTTLEARKRYFEYNPPKGVLKLIPVSFRIPPCPYDDFAAFLIAERFFEDNSRK